MPTWQRAALPWEVLQLLSSSSSSSYLSQGQPYQNTTPPNLTPRITLPLSIGLPPGEKRERRKKKGSHLSLLFSTSSPHLPPSPRPRSPAHPSVQPSALHLSRGSLQSQDNLETSAGSLPETLKKFPPSLILSLYPHLFCTPHPAAPARPPPDHRDAAPGPPPLPPPPTQASFPSLLPFIFQPPRFLAFSASSDCDQD